MKTHIIERGKCTEHSARALMFLLGFFLSPQSLATDIHPEWSNDHIAALFPAPMDGWSVGELTLEESDTVTSGFESFVTGVSGVQMGVSTRVLATRSYAMQERTIIIIVDSSDIEMAATIDAITAAHSADDASQPAPEEVGVKPISRQGYFGFSAQEGDRAGLMFKVGSAGIVAMECDYNGCAEDLAVMTERLDLVEFAGFADFDHRR